MLNRTHSFLCNAKWWGLFLLLTCIHVAWAGGVVTECSEAALRHAMTGGGKVTFACDGIITLTGMLTITDDVILDGTGHGVSLSGSNAVRIFYVPTNAVLTLINLTVMNGFAAQGAGLFNDGGIVFLKDVSFLTNKTVTVIDLNVIPGAGGALYTRFGRVNATNCSFTGNVAHQPIAFDLGLSASGGAVYSEQGEINLEDCSLLDNRAIGGGATNYFGYSEGASACGGAVYNSGQLNMTRCVFKSNAVLAGPGTPSVYDKIGGPGGNAAGGAVFNSGSLRMARTSFLHNSCAAGSGCDTEGLGGLHEGPGPPGGKGGEGRGGAIFSSGQLWVDSCTFASNSLAGGDGGHGGLGGQSGMSWMGQEGGPGGRGGAAKGSALFVGAETRLLNCTLAWNFNSGGKGGQGGKGGRTERAGAPGGLGGTGGNGGDGQACLNESAGGLTMTNCTIASNGGTGGAGGLGGPGGESSPSATVPFGPDGQQGTNGLALGGLYMAGGQLVNTLLATNAEGNCVGATLDLGHNLSSDNTPGFTAPGSKNDTDPKLGPLGEYGGQTPFMTLLAGSPAIDSADTASAAPYDQRGFSRPLGLAADIGACEYAELTLHKPGFVAAESFGFEVRGTLGLRFAVESASPSLDWERLCTNTLSSAPVSFLHQNAANDRGRYYRAVVLPNH